MRDLVMIEVLQLGFVPSADVDHASSGVVEIFLGGISPQNGHLVKVEEDTAGKEVVLVCTPRMSDDLT